MSYTRIMWCLRSELNQRHADFQWQRPFSEGCGGEIPEKTKKNLSQSYGRWIVGFHEPMTSALFAFKKGAKNGGVLYDSKMAASH